jgi:hypothetical protein
MNTAIKRWGTWWEAFELRWPRPRYTILTEPTGPWGHAWEGLPRLRIHVSELEEFHDPGWVIEDVEPEGDPSTPAWSGPNYRYRVEWPAGGIFVPEGDDAKAPTYEPLAVAPEILLDVHRTRVDDPTALLRFVNRWGPLGVGIPGAPQFEADGVAFAGEHLAWLSGLAQTLHALQRGEKTAMSWNEMADQLTRALANVHFGARPTKHALVPHFPVPRLLDALVLEVWDMATEGKRLRQCPECQALFIHGREDKRYCSAACAKRRTVREWKRRQRRRRDGKRRTRKPKEA